MQALDNELAKNLKTPEELNQFDRLLKNQPKIGSYARNGYSTKTITTGDGAPLELRSLRDSDGSCEPQLVKKSLTDVFIEPFIEWQNRPLYAVYPIVYLNCIVLKVRQDSRVIKKSVLLALGINLEGQKEFLGIWLS